MIPEAAVEAAAREAFFVDDIGGHIRGRWTWETIPEDGRENYRKLALAVVTAAAPHMLADLAEVWDDGHEQGFWNGRQSSGDPSLTAPIGKDHADAANPYRPTT